MSAEDRLPCRRPGWTLCVMVEELMAYAREAFGWGDGVAVGEPRRGALGQIRRVETGGAVYALKEIFGEPPPEALVAAELAFARRAAEAECARPPAIPTCAAATWRGRRQGRGCACTTGST
ncbi:hypothetical protein ACFQ0B_69480 [Nonomuraea thailandensis]